MWLCLGCVGWWLGCVILVVLGSGFVVYLGVGCCFFLVLFLVLVGCDGIFCV